MRLVAIGMLTLLAVHTAKAQVLCGFLGPDPGGFLFDVPDRPEQSLAAWVFAVSGVGSSDLAMGEVRVRGRIAFQAAVAYTLASPLPAQQAASLELRAEVIAVTHRMSGST